MLGGNTVLANILKEEFLAELREELKLTHTSITASAVKRAHMCEHKYKPWHDITIDRVLPADLCWTS